MLHHNLIPPILQLIFYGKMKQTTLHHNLKDAQVVVAHSFTPFPGIQFFYFRLSGKNVHLPGIIIVASSIYFFKFTYL